MEKYDVHRIPILTKEVELFKSIVVDTQTGKVIDEIWVEKHNIINYDNGDRINNISI